MSRVGKTLNNVTEDVIRATGVVAKNSGEALSELGKSMGVSSSKCNRMERKADKIGKDLYYSGSNVGRKVEQITDEVVDSSKKAYKSISSKFKV